MLFRTIPETAFVKGAGVGVALYEVGRVAFLHDDFAGVIVIFHTPRVDGTIIEIPLEDTGAALYRYRSSVTVTRGSRLRVVSSVGSRSSVVMIVILRCERSVVVIGDW